MTQPALTARIQALEAELETTLFVRGRRGMALTDAGRAFLPYAERALGGAGRGRLDAGGTRRGGIGQLVLGAAPAISAYVLPPTAAALHASATRGSGWSVRTGHSEEILEMALRREIDLGLVRELQHPDIESRPLYDDELVLVARRDACLRPSEDTIDLAELSDVAADPVRPDVELLRPDERVLPRGRCRHRAASWSSTTSMPRSRWSARDWASRCCPIRRSLASSPTGGCGDHDPTARQPIRRPIVAIRRPDLGPPTGPMAAFLEILAGVGEILPEASPGRALARERSP